MGLFCRDGFVMVQVCHRTSLSWLGLLWGGFVWVGIVKDGFVSDGCVMGFGLSWLGLLMERVYLE